MGLKDKKWLVIALALIIGVGSFTGYIGRKAYNSARAKYEPSKIELQYYRQAERINDYYARFDVNTRLSVIRKTLQSIDIYLPKYFPKGPYERKDLIAIAMVESAFEQYLTGSRGEYGIFQIMPESSKWAGVEKNQFDIEVNTEMALFVLKKKHDEHKDYKLGIIAYNGFVKKRGKVSEKYWDQFIKYRTALDDILRHTSNPTAK